MAGRIYGILFLARVHVANGPRTDVAEFDEPCVPNACLMLLQPGDLSLRVHEVAGFDQACMEREWTCFFFLRIATT